MNPVRGLMLSRLTRLAPYTVIIISTVVGILLYLLLFAGLSAQFISNVEDQRRAGLVQLVRMARNAIEPSLERVRIGALSKEDGRIGVRNLVRRMTYDDQYGPNYIFMSAYDGTMLVQPFEPHMEMTPQWDLRDEHGTYIIRELVRAARSGPEGGFVSYYYYPPDSPTPQEKLAYALPIPELDCYIGTGMYMQRAYIEQKQILTQARAWSVAFVVLLFITSFIAIREIVKRNRELAAEIEVRRRAQESLELFRNLIDNSHDSIFLVDPDSGGILEANRKAWEILGYDRDELLSLRTTDIELVYRHGTDRRSLVARVRHDGHAILDGTLIRKDGTTVPSEVSIRYVSMGGRGYLVSVARDVTERRIADEKIKASLHEKETLLREIHHRVKNNFQIITSLLNLQERKIRNEEAAAELADSRNRIRAMALVHEQLYQSHELSYIDFGPYLQSLARGLQRTYPGDIDIIFHTEHVPLAIETAIPCGLIVSELISNSLKHAFPHSFAGDRKINVTLIRRPDGSIEIGVRDNGIGLPEDIENRKKNSLGLSLVEILARQVKGTVSVRAEGGTTQVLRFEPATDDRKE